MAARNGKSLRASNCEEASETMPKEVTAALWGGSGITLRAPAPATDNPPSIGAA